MPSTMFFKSSSSVILRFPGFSKMKDEFRRILLECPDPLQVSTGVENFPYRLRNLGR